jgi:hypothetical protein
VSAEVRPGVRRAGVPKAEPGAGAGPAAPRAAPLDLRTAKIGNASQEQNQNQKTGGTRHAAQVRARTFGCRYEEAI